ncbi:unnamed protein product [Parnassius mnemosyne]|uniref:C2H2-type domain-containing protein n=1 Tax=Parnassius mnemosyne TaxID=213953 RepID=A0AAV1KP55_9NEOP
MYSFRSRKLLCVSSIKKVLTEYFKLSDEDLDHSGLEFICEKCDNESSFQTLQSFVEHLKLQHKFEIKDNKSVENFMKEYVSIVEMLVSEDQIADLEPEKGMVDVKIPRFYCPFCENAFSSTTRLICHLNQHVDVCIEKGVACCDNVYKDTKSFAVHLQERHVNHPPNATNICQSCGFAAEDSQQLQSHVSKEHYVEKDDVNNVKERLENHDRCQKYIPAVCPECNKTFSNKYNMLVHMKSHNGTTEKFHCNRCNKTYKSQASLKFHQKVSHEGILSFLCSYCGEAFPSRVERDVHTRIHSGKKPYTCKYCGNSYRAKNTLDRHVEIHLDIRKYECHICSKKFRKRTHLNYHLTTHKRKK